ncbi:hypothetical protein DPMN_023525 [Dreissena polymorpha]|uniref:Uncharacterized protein n=1 Tax=Dreissena polymorpha TaxID=45954 RepID=A0A9D4LKV9_DREPO|nr:hypothetical protein DPMN_023525 [Dreissena polymorpha]
MGNDLFKWSNESILTRLPLGPYVFIERSILLFQQYMFMQQQQRHPQQQAQPSESSDEDQFNVLLQERLQIRPPDASNPAQGPVNASSSAPAINSHQSRSASTGEELIVFSDIEKDTTNHNPAFQDSRFKKPPIKPQKPRKSTVSCYIVLGDILNILKISFNL